MIENDFDKFFSKLKTSGVTDQKEISQYLNQHIEFLTDALNYVELLNPKEWDKMHHRIMEVLTTEISLKLEEE